MNRSLRVAIVGTGPAGMYALEHLQEEQNLDVEVDLFERLPVPWGLVRYGVAPDHPEKKLVADRLFSYFIGRKNVRYFGNVEIGKDIQHSELAGWYDSVIYAVGANSDTKMGIPGEELPGSWAAREFVAWYNGHPDFSNLQFDLSGSRAVIVGNGNVALDVARILTTPVDDLAKTDIADYALEALRGSQIEEIMIMGRRGYLQGAFSNPELEELEHLPGVDVSVESDDLISNSNLALEDVDWTTTRKIRTLVRLITRNVPDARKRIVFRFLSSPVEILGEGKVEQLRVLNNRLEYEDDGEGKAYPTKTASLIDTTLVLKAIGYRGNPIPGLPFDEANGVISNIGGRVVNMGKVVPGAYVTGWIKRGPRGIIGSNKRCSRKTVDCLLADLEAKKLDMDSTLSADKVLSIVQDRKPEYVPLQAWRNIDRFERQAGRECNRPRVKCSSNTQMLRLAHG